MDLKNITPMVLTFNEAANIERCLASLAWAETILVVDSYSTDETLSLLARNPRVQIEQRKFDSFAGQWNHALASSKVRTPWVMALDADYEITGELLAELKAYAPDAATTSAEIGFTYCIYGEALSGSLYPPLPVLFKKEGATFLPDGHTMRLRTSPGKRDKLENKIRHDDRKTVARWLASQSGYMDREVEKLATKPSSQWTWREKLRSNFGLTPFLVFFYTLFAKGTLFQGWAGWTYAYQRLVAELVLQLRLTEQRHNPAVPSASQPIKKSA